MGVAGGPNILGDENLVFAYDVADQNSYLGEPTTNFIPSPYDYSLYAYASGPVNITTTNESGNTITAKRYTITQAVNVARAAIFPTGLTTGVAYTFSVKWRYNGTTTTTPGFGMDASKGNPEVGGSNTFTSQSSSVISIGRGWYLSTYTFIFNTSPTSGCILTFGISTGATAGYVNETFDLYEAQFEVKDHRTQFIIGTRSVTGSLFDLSQNKTIVNVSNMSFDSNAQLVFDGTNDFIDLPSSLTYTTSVSAFAWCKTNGIPSGGYHIVFGPTSLEISIPTSGQLRTGIDASTRYVSNHGSGLTDGNWHYIGFTFQDTTKTSYIDGVSVGTQTTSGSLVSNVPNRSMGRFGTSTVYYMNGNISTAQIYSRALTPEEVLQNYNAQKSRFNL